MCLKDLIESEESMLKLLKREGNYALFARLKNFKDGKGEVIYAYEVHKIRKKLLLSRTRKHFKEILADDEDFGKYGWSFSSYDAALKEFNDRHNENTLKRFNNIVLKRK